MDKVKVSGKRQKSFSTLGMERYELVIVQTKK
jgi:hypothetical protein